METRQVIVGRQISLGVKLALMAFCVVLVASLFFAAVNLFGVQWYRTAAVSRMEFAGGFFAERLLQQLDLMASDGRKIAALPEIDGVVAATGQGLHDQKVQESPDIYGHRRLEAVFDSVLRTRPHYSQLRYIGRDDNWREVVRVNRVSDRTEGVRRSALQSKGDEPYLADEAALDAGQPFFSRVTLNREQGRDEGPPTIRLVVPVPGSDGRAVGALVINADFESILRAAVIYPADGYVVTAMTSSGDFMRYDPVTGPGPLRFHGTPGWRAEDLPDLSGIVPSGSTRATKIGWQRAINVTGLSAASLSRGERLPLRTDIFVVTELPTPYLFAPIRQQLVYGLAAGIVLSVLAGLVAWHFGNRLTGPLNRLARGLRASEPGDDLRDLIPESNDEVAELARAVVKLNERLYQKSAKLNAIFAEAADGLITINQEGVIEEANVAVARIFGYEPSELLGRNVSMLMSDKEAVKHDRMMRRRIGQATPQRLIAGREMPGKRKDGTEITVEISVASTSHAGGTRFIGVLRDVSSRREAQARSEALVQALERSNADLDAFAYFASHDLKAPLRVIDNASAWLEEDLAPYLNDDTRDSMNLLRSRVARMDRLLDDLLNHSRIGRIDEKAQIVEGRELASELRGLLNLPEGFTFEVTPDFDKLHIPNMPIKTILLNLLGNSLKHHDRPTGLVRLSGRETDDAYCLSVSDDGPGIPPAYHKKVFEMFQTLRPRDEVEASGMGLAMVLKYVQIAGGQVRIESDGGRGTTMHVVWPKVRAKSGKSAWRAA
ncbi:hypothetical protein BV509_07955 [Rhodovulum sulfidophilum]|uniref:HAMP domain-containing histidine kinase n=1 Tax=Rhodovulum visakhapatnamense TaxID=364297 RepID=UPI000951A747|nr:HAMP domain-containing histidine kinase [Rhodovulum visakhapatnamense]MBL3569360.1 HAMP domain-containing histidine kinase [Rhodovulum visakhapatnamense]OLS44279.1 hypothetical protein BV509_07955 [Rhodovulum sulfidophilum]